MTNFSFLPSTFRTITDSARKAEGHILGDPRAACFHARFALESIVHWLYRHDAKLQLPYDQSLGALLHDPGFQNRVPQAVFQKARVIQKQGNQAVHSQRPIRQFDAMQVVRELHHICYWLARTYAPESLSAAPAVTWDDALIPRPASPADVVPRKELEAAEKRLSEQHEQALAQQQERDELDAQLQTLRAQLAEVRTQSEAKPDPHDYSEADTRKYIIDVDLRRAGWTLEEARDVEYEVRGMPNTPGVGYADYVLWGDDGKPLGVVEAKKTTVNPEAGQQQAKLYADCLEQMHGQRPVIFYANGYKTWMWDDESYPPRRVSGFLKKDELELLIRRRTQRQKLDVAKVKDKIAGRYYQKRAIGNIFEQLTNARRKGLLVMATGTGKTRTAVALVDVLQRAGWVKRALFLADRVSLVKQACNAFKEHLPESSPVNLVTEKDTEGRVYVCTYPTMMGLIDQNDGGEARFGAGHFDLVIIDEAHRSVYQRYGAIFEYFDSLLIGLTATPREEIDKNTYNLFDLEPGVPTDAYELTTAVADGFLVPPKVQKVDLKFPREGIEYDELSEEEKEQWESLDWGDNLSGTDADRVNAPAINNWLFNEDTVDKVLQHVMEHGHKVEGGDRLAKTIIFARNHDHAVFIEERFNHHYPHYKGHFARVIDNYAKYPQSLIDEFSLKENNPHIAISVDMMDTGIDVPEVANLVFFKPVYSKIKFWQMIGRGTRLCPDLFGPEMDKQDFRVFDFCFNYDYFNENPDGLEASTTKPLGERIFSLRVELLGQLQSIPDHDREHDLASSIAEGLHAEVAAMNLGNFLVRMRLEAVERFRQRESWQNLSDEDCHVLTTQIAALPGEPPVDEIESRMFDLTLLRMQLALVEGRASAFDTGRKRVIEIASLLEEKAAIPIVAAQLEYLAAIQETVFWEAITLTELESLRQRLRSLVPLLDKSKRKMVYSDFEDQILGVREGVVVDIPNMTGAQYEKKVRDYLKNHLNHIVIHRLRSNQPLTDSDLDALEQMLEGIGGEDGKTLLSGLLQRSESPSLSYFVRSMVGMDRAAAQAAFARFLGDQSLDSNQIRFVELIVEQLTSRGVMDAAALYEPPFSDLHAEGPEALFLDHEHIVTDILKTLRVVQSS